MKTAYLLFGLLLLYLALTAQRYPSPNFHQTLNRHGLPDYGEAGACVETYLHRSVGSDIGAFCLGGQDLHPSELKDNQSGKGLSSVVLYPRRASSCWRDSFKLNLPIFVYCPHRYLLYRYRFNQNAPWQYTDNPAVKHPLLTPGSHRLEMQARNESGHWSRSMTYAFTIQPPWWQVWWARTLAGGLLLVGFIFYQRQHRTHLRKEAAVQQQISALERSALQAQMNPHFIFNCLNSIQHFVLKNDKRKAVELLSRFATLVRHNLNASVQGEVNLTEEVRILEDYLALERERFDHKIDYRITVDKGLDHTDITFPPLLILPYVENAVIHGLSKKGGSGRVDIHFGRENGHLAVTVRDNGTGYCMDGKRELSTRHKSVGMTITRKRLELLCHREGECVEIERLENERKEVLGTEVRVRIAVSSLRLRDSFSRGKGEERLAGSLFRPRIPHLLGFEGKSVPG